VLLDRYINDIKKVPDGQIDALCNEIRAFLIKNISRTGGHLASNLGVVELTVALHRVMDTARDRVVFDVGHQCYVHKLLTGRREGFGAFRTFGCMAGFPKPQESPHDAFVTGHASTSVSAALGMARARTLLGENYKTAAVIGDGALTGGMAYEGLNDAGASGEGIVVILNDNNMSITGNVGGVARHLARLRVNPQYFHAKKIYHKILDPLPGGSAIDKVLSRGKQAIKDIFIPGSMFQEMGFEYLGPIDGHDVRKLSYLLKKAFDMNKPVVIHAITQKGRGYSHSENDPTAYHGVSRFHVDSGRAVKKDVQTYSDVFGNELVLQAEKKKEICAITAAMRDGTGLSGFARRFPGRFFDVGIAEEHAVTMAGAMAKQGMRPVVALYSSFLQRSYDQLVHDVALQNLPVLLMVDRAGLVGEDGETHHGTLDPLYLSSIPNMTVWAPAGFAELRDMISRALCHNGPIAIRYPRGGQGAYRSVCTGDCSVLRVGGNAGLVTYGRMANTAMEAAEILQKSGASLSIFKVSTLKPFPKAELEKLIDGRDEVFLLEDGPGYLNQHIAGTPINTGDRFIPHGSVDALERWCGIDSHSVAVKIADSLGLTLPEKEIV